MIKTINKEVDSCFSCVKITLIVLYVLSLIAIICLIAISVIGLKIANSDDINPEHKLTPGQKEETKQIFTKSLCIGLIQLIMLLVGLIGIIKENKIIMISILALGIIETVVYLLRGSIPLALTELLSTILTGIYLKMIVNKRKHPLNYNTDKLDDYLGHV